MHCPYFISINSVANCVCVRARDIWKMSNPTPNFYSFMPTLGFQLCAHCPVQGCPQPPSSAQEQTVVFPALSVLLTSAVTD